jgi:cytochrome c biogenesis protein CcmG, thiol:disulfide interchange protein DsbE
MARPVKIGLQATAVLVVALLVGLLAWQVVRTDQGRSLRDKVAAGEKPAAPVFQLDQLGQSSQVSLADLRGKAVVVNFWASWCRPCKDETQALEEAWQRWRQRDVVVVGVDLQDFSGDAQRFVDRYGISYPVLRDRHNWTWGRYGLTGLPETWFVDRHGRLVGEYIEGPVSPEELDRNIRIALGTPS